MATLLRRLLLSEMCARIVKKRIARAWRQVKGGVGVGGTICSFCSDREHLLFQLTNITQLVSSAAPLSIQPYRRVALEELRRFVPSSILCRHISSILHLARSPKQVQSRVWFACRIDGALDRLHRWLVQGQSVFLCRQAPIFIIILARSSLHLSTNCTTSTTTACRRASCCQRSICVNASICR